MLKLLTVPEVAERIGQPMRRVQNLADQGRIRPAAIAGSYRLFTEDQLPEVEKIAQAVKPCVRKKRDPDPDQADADRRLDAMGFDRQDGDKAPTDAESESRLDAIGVPE